MSDLRQQVAEAIHKAICRATPCEGFEDCWDAYADELLNQADAVLALLNLTEEGWTTKVRILLGEEADAYDAGYAAGISRRLPSHHTDSSELA